MELLEAESAKHGFDLTDISGDDWKEVLKAIGAKDTPKKNKDGYWDWKGKNVLIVTKNDPITGEPKGEEDYASYIGIEGDKAQVAKAAKMIKAKGDSKDESPSRRDFI